MVSHLDQLNHAILLEREGFLKGKVLGNGQNAVVYDVSDNLVLRKSTGYADGFKLLYNLTPELVDSVSLVKIFAVSSCGTYALLEKLYPVDYIEMEVPPLLWELVSDFHTIPEQTPTSLKKIAQDALKLHGVVYGSDNVVDLDFYSDNVMMRKDGTLVLSDPLGHFHSNT